MASSIDPAVWGLAGTITGGLLALGGNWVLHRAERKERAQREQREAADRARDERKEVYIRLLAAARRLRYQARRGSPIDRDEVNSLRSELSNAHYEIELIAPAGVIAQSDALVLAVLAYLNQARDQVSPSDNAVQDSTMLQTKRVNARAAVDAFIDQARKDLGRG